MLLTFSARFFLALKFYSVFLEEHRGMEILSKRVSDNIKTLYGK